MPSELYIGGGVHMPLGGAVDYWPVAGVTEPQHHWPFVQTGDYTDQGSTGGLDLDEQGTNNSFNNGLVLDGTGWATGANNADVCSLGSTFSILFEGSWSNTSVSAFISGANQYLGEDYDGWYILTGYNGTSGSWRTVNPQNNLNVLDKTDIFTPTTTYQIVIVHSGGTSTCYVDGSPVSGWSGAMPDPTNMTTRPFAIGSANYNNSYLLTGTVKRVAVLKGTGWSGDNVTAIYAAFS